MQIVALVVLFFTLVNAMDQIPPELLKALEEAGLAFQVITPEDIKQGKMPDIVGSQLEEAPPAIQALLAFGRVQMRSRDARAAATKEFSAHLVEEAKMKAVGYIGGKLDAREGGVIEVLTELLEPDNMAGGMSDSRKTGQDEWTAIITMTRRKGDPLALTLVCQLQDEKIASIQAEVEPTAIGW